MKCYFLFIGFFAITLVSCKSIAITKRQHRPGYAIEVRQSHSRIDCNEFKLTSKKASPKVELVAAAEKINLLPTKEKEKIVNATPKHKVSFKETEPNKQAEKVLITSSIKNKTKAKYHAKVKNSPAEPKETNWAFWSGVLKFLSFIGILFLGSLIAFATWFLAFFYAYGGSVGLSILFLFFGIVLVPFILVLSVIFLIKVKYFKKKRGMIK